MTSVVTFQITPYSDAIATYINSLPEEQIYTLFRENVGADVLTAALYGIYKLESSARSTILTMDNISGSYPNSYQNIDRKILNSLSEVYLRDELLFSQNLNELTLYPNAFVLVINGIYSGHIYAWTVENTDGPGRVTNVIGMRSSILELLLDPRGLQHSSITTIFLNAIRTWAVNQDIRLVQAANGLPHYIRVLQPIGLLPGLLTKCGFVMTKILRNQDGMNWLFDNGSMGDIALVRQLLFREYDYIAFIDTPLQCSGPTYAYREIS